MPTIYRVKGYSFFFFSNEGDPQEPAHIHLRKGSSTAKFWLEPEVRLENSYALNTSELNEIEGIIEQKQDLFKEAWYAYFGSYGSSQEGLD